jgi:hypothetical protein
MEVAYHLDRERKRALTWVLEGKQLGQSEAPVGLNNGSHLLPFMEI